MPVQGLILENASVLLLPEAEQLKGLLASSLFNFFAILFIAALFAEFMPGKRLLRVASFGLAAYTLFYLVFVEGRSLSDALVVVAMGFLALIDLALKAVIKMGAKAAVVPPKPV